MFSSSMGPLRKEKNVDKFYVGTKVVAKQGFNKVRAGMTGKVESWSPDRDTFTVRFDVDSKTIEVVVEKAEMDLWFHILETTAYTGEVKSPLKKWLKATRD